MSTIESLSHTQWDCKHPIVFLPKGRKKAIYGTIHQGLREILHQLAAQKECVIVEGRLCSDHIHMLIRIPPKYSVAHVVGLLKGKSAIMIARELMGRERSFAGQSFWARGYFVSTVGVNEATIRRYIQHQEKADRREDKPRLFKSLIRFSQKQSALSGSCLKTPALPGDTYYNARKFIAREFVQNL